MNKVLIDRALLERAVYRLELAYDADAPIVCDLSSVLSAPSGTPAMPVKAYYHEALAGYAVRDARIATQEAQIKALQSGENCWQSGYDQGRLMGAKHCTGTIDQLRAELAALNAKLDASKFCADVADDLQAELAAIKAQEPAFMWHKGATEDESEVVDVDCACPCCVPLYAAPVSEAKAHNRCLDEVASLYAAPVQQVSVPDGFERYRLADKFCEQRLVTDDHVRAIVVDAFASGYGFGIAAAPVAKQVVMPDADHSEDVRTMVPDGWLVEKMADNGVSGFIVRTPRAEGVRTCTAVFPDDDDPAHRLLAMLLASPPAKGGE